MVIESFVFSTETNTTQCVGIPVINDTLNEGFESFQIIVSSLDVSIDVGALVVFIVDEGCK